MNYAAYQQDFLLWLQQQVELLQQGRLAELDMNNLVEELESMGISQHHQFLNHLRVLLMHLLKLRSFRTGRKKNGFFGGTDDVW